MLNVSTATKQAYKDFGRSRQIEIKIYANPTITLTNDDIAINTLSIEEILESSDNLTFTGCNASVLKFKSVNTLEDISGKKIEVKVTTGNTDTIPLFTGYIDSAENTSYVKASMDIVAYDALYKINRIDYKSWYNSLFVNHDYVTLKELRDNFFTRVNIQQETVDLPNDSMTIYKTVEDQNLMGETILKCICMLNGRYGRIGRDGKFQYVSLEGSGLYPSLTLYPSNYLYPGMSTAKDTINNAEYKFDSIRFSKYKTERIDSVQIVDKDNHVVASAGATTQLNIFTISDNPFVWDKTTEDLQTVANNIKLEIDECNYTPLSLDMIGLPYLECGDYISVVVRDSVLNTFIMHRTITGEQALNDTIESKGDQYLPIFSPNTDGKIQEAIARAKEEAKDAITEYDEAVQIMNELAINAMGAYQDYEEAESGGRIYYLSNMPIEKLPDGTLRFDNLSVIFKKAGTGLWVSLPNDPPSADRVWTNGYDALTGKLVVNVLNAIGISADWVNTGLLKQSNYPDGNYWNLDTGEFRLMPTTKIGSYTTSDYNNINGRNFAIGTYTGITKIVDGTVVEGPTRWDISPKLVEYIDKSQNVKFSLDIQLTGVRLTAEERLMRIGIHMVGISAETGQERGIEFSNSFMGPITEDIPFEFSTASVSRYKTYFSSITSIDYAFVSTFASQGTIEIKNFKCEISDTFTEWSYAPEDEFNMIDGLQDQIDGKIETFYQANDPSTSWTADQKLAHTGDLWYRTTDDTQWRWNGSVWEEQTQAVPQDVYDKIDGKAQIFTSTPTPPYHVGDLWFNSTTSDIMTCMTARSSGNYQSSDWQKRNKYTDDTATNNLDSRLNQRGVWERLTGSSTDCIILNNDGSLGIRATAIVTGVLSDAYKNNYWNLETGELRMTAGAKVKDTNADYSGAYIPTNDNEPAINWTTDTLKKQNLGKTFNDTTDSNNIVTYIYKTGGDYPETAHPYTNNEDKYYKFETGLTAPIKITFNSQSVTEGNNYDYIDLFYYENPSDYNAYTRRVQGSIGGLEVIIPVNTFYLHWHTDGSAIRWGWKIDSIVSSSGSPTGFTRTTMEAAIWETIENYGWKLATLEDYISGVAGANLPEGVTTEDVFNALTEDGARQIIAYDTGGHLYINAEYVRGGIIEVGGTNASENAQFRVKNSIGTQVGKWDVNGFSANVGNFGNLKLDSTTSQAYVEGFKQIIPKDTSYTLNNGTSSANKGIDLKININPFAEGYAEDFKIIVNVGITESGSHSSSTTVGAIKLYRISSSNSWTQLTSVSIKNSGSSYTMYSLSPTLDHTWGDDKLERYQLQIKVNRDETYNSWLRSCKLDVYATNTSGNALRMAVFGSTEITGSLRGSFTGAINATSFNVNDTVYIDNSSSLPDSFVVRNPSDGSNSKISPTSVLAYYNDNNQVNMSASSGGANISRTNQGTWEQAKWDSSSDRRIKEEIKDITTEIATEIIDNTSPKSFKFINRDGRHYGVIAQEVREVLNNAGEEDIQLEHGIDIETEVVDKRFVDYEEFVPLLIKYVQDLRSEINTLKEEIAKLKEVE